MPDRFSIGDEVWALRYDRDANNYAPCFEGTIEAVGYRGYFAGGKWHDGYPLFRSEAEAKAWIAENPFEVPTIK
jgi:hypothetical protein